MNSSPILEQDYPIPESRIKGKIGKRITQSLQNGELIYLEYSLAPSEAIFITADHLSIARSGMMYPKSEKLQSIPLQEIQFIEAKKQFLVCEIIIHTKPGLYNKCTVYAENLEKGNHIVNQIKQYLSTKNITIASSHPKNAKAVSKSSLPGKLSIAIDNILRPSEEVLKEIHSSGEGMTVTSERVLIVKGGYASHALFGQKVKSFSFDAISSVEVSAGIMVGRIQITASGTSENSGSSKDISDTSRMENVVQITIDQLPLAREIANLIEIRRKDAKTPKITIDGSNLSQLSIADEITKLIQLKENGVLTEQEFEQAKSKLINSP